MHRARSIQLSLVGLLILAACSSPRGGTSDIAPEGSAPNTLTRAERAAGWRLLFDGVSTAGWRGYRRANMPEGWAAVDGALARVSQAADIITIEQFGNFELALEWNIAPGGNSGVFYRAVEGPDYVWLSAPEMQVLDDERHADGRLATTSAGSNFAIHAVPRGAVKPAGQWNAARVVVNGNHVEHWLNGVKVVEYELGSRDWAERVAASKFKDAALYGKAARGHIGLQDHGDRVAFRNIKIRQLP